MDVKVEYYEDGTIKSLLFLDENEQYHCSDGPAERRWSKEGKLVFEMWMEHGRESRAGGPAMRQWSAETGELTVEAWYRDGVPHREDGPAIITYSDTGCVVLRQWRIDGELHREDGPAFIRGSGDSSFRCFYLKGRCLEEEEFCSRMNLRREDTENGPVWVKWSSPEALIREHECSPAHGRVLSVLQALVMTEPSFIGCLTCAGIQVCPREETVEVNIELPFGTVSETGADVKEVFCKVMQVYEEELLAVLDDIRLNSDMKEAEEKELKRWADSWGLCLNAEAQKSAGPRNAARRFGPLLEPGNV